jgi:hypothetical protein
MHHTPGLFRLAITCAPAHLRCRMTLFAPSSVENTHHCILTPTNTNTLLVVLASMQAPCISAMLCVTFMVNTNSCILTVPSFSWISSRNYCWLWLYSRIFPGHERCRVGSQVSSVSSNPFHLTLYSVWPRLTRFPSIFSTSYSLLVGEGSLAIRSRH